MERSLVITLSDKTLPYFKQIAADLQTTDPSTVIEYIVNMLQAIELTTGQDPGEFCELLSNGDIVLVPVVKSQVCPDCKGSRWQPRGELSTKACDTCGGSGKVPR